MTQNPVTVKRILNCIPSRKTENDWKMHVAVSVGVMAAAPSIPDTKDLREDWWQIGDQGETGSCVGWATADSVLRWHFVKANLLNLDQHLSPRFTWMASKETDEFRLRATSFIESAGTSLKGALDVSRRFGAVPDAILPFTFDHLYQDEEEVFYAIAARFKIKRYFNLGSDFENWRSWLATRGPILTRLDVDETWFKATETHGLLATYDSLHVYGGHAVALVGYTPDHFIVRNSWGTDWGDEGFAYATPAYAQVAFTEAYGVTI
jgi:hypothetical protein